MREIEVNVSGRWIAGGIAGLLVAGYFAAGITNIDLHEAGFAVKMIGSEETRGKTTELLPGTHWVEPITNDVFAYDTRFKQYDEGLKNICNGINTKDGQPICIDLSLEVGLDKSKLGKLHTDYGPDWYEKVIHPRTRSQARFATSSVSSDEIYGVEGKVKAADYLQKQLKDYESAGIITTVNLRNATFTNKDFVKTLEEKATATQKEIIEERLAKAAEQTAIKMENLARGEKLERIQRAEADKEEKRLAGEGERLRLEEEAKGVLELKKANAEGTRLEVQAYGGGQYYAQVRVAEELGDNFQVYGIPTGAPGTTSLMGIDKLIGGVAGGSMVSE